MIAISLEELCTAIGAKLLPRAVNAGDFLDSRRAGTKHAKKNALPVIEHISTDTRQMRPGSLFIAIRGEHADGHAFVVGAQSGSVRGDG